MKNVPLAAVTAAAAAALLCGVSAELVRADQPTTGPTAATPANPPRSAEQIMAAIQAVPRPNIQRERVQDPDYRATLEAELAKYRQAMAPLRDELLQNFPDHPQASRFVQSWIMEQGGNERDIEKVKQAAVAYAKAHPNTAAGKAALGLRAQATLMQPNLTYAEGRQAIDEANAATGKNEESGELEAMLIERASDYSPQQKVDAYKKLIADNPAMADSLSGRIKQTEGIGKPFELAFKDVVTGKDMSIAGMKGKVVIVDFWATWCGPCIAELPEQKEMYERLHPKGLEIIGVSLDQPESEGGKKELTEFLAKEKIAWPIYYQGNGWESDFSKSWGMRSIPAYFVIDQNGNLHATNLRGPALTQAVEKLLGVQPETAAK